MALRIFVGVVVAGQLLGGVVGISILARGSPAEAATLGQAVKTSFGVLSVDQVEEIAASNPDRDPLPPDLKEVQVAVTMTNLLNHPVPYSRTQLGLRVAGSPVTIPVASASIYSGRLRPETAFRAIYRFYIPTAPADLRVRYADPGRAAAIWVDLGNRRIPVGVSSAYNPRLHSYSPHYHGVGK